MCCLRDLIVFLAGAEFFHTLAHVFLPRFVELPLDAGFLVLNEQNNMMMIIVNGLITLALLFIAHKMKKRHSECMKK